MELRSTVASLVLLATSSPLAWSLLMVTDNSMSNMVTFSGPKHNCSVTHNRVEIMQAVLSAGTAYNVMRSATSNEMDALMTACDQHNSAASQYTVHMDTQADKPAAGFIYPGTKWCGPGSVAKSYTDLGDKVEEDRCCRDHDNCPAFIEAGQCKYGICNRSPFTRSDCKCDRQFQFCLQRIRSNSADTIGALYFNLARVMCFNDPARCQQNPSSCKYKYMPYYKTSGSRRNLKSLFSEVLRGLLRLKRLLI